MSLTCEDVGGASIGLLVGAVVPAGRPYRRLGQLLLIWKNAEKIPFRLYRAKRDASDQRFPLKRKKLAESDMRK